MECTARSYAAGGKVPRGEHLKDAGRGHVDGRGRVGPTSSGSMNSQPPTTTARFYELNSSDVYFDILL